jgi:hypothetical protein
MNYGTVNRLMMFAQEDHSELWSQVKKYIWIDSDFFEL